MEQDPEHLILRILNGEASEEEQASLQQWLAQKPELQELYNSYLEIWNNSRRRKEFNNVSKNLALLNHKIDIYEKERKIQTLTWAKVAASVIFLLATTASAYFYIKTLHHTPIIWKERSTLAAQKMTLSLPDGSTVKLNANSSIRFPEAFDPDLREVFCTGETFFDVVKDSLRPFIVHTGEVTTRVLGTSFNIRENDASIAVTVATGKVSVGNSEVNEIIYPNQKVIYQKASQELVALPADLLIDLAWKDNTLIFSDTPLNQVATTLESWYGVNISFTHDLIGNCLITGKYRNEPIEKVVSAISFSTGLHYKLENNNLIWSGPGCTSTKP